MNVEEENTYRALRDEQPLITSRWCSFGIHKWEKWSKPYQHDKSKATLIQHSYCACCNLIRAKKVETPRY